MKLTINNLQVNYDKVTAVKNISIAVDSGSFVTLIGSNGAGKSTTLRAISGLVKSRIGEIYLDDIRIDAATTDAIVRLGVGHVPEGRRIFKDLSVQENLMLGAFTCKDKSQNEIELRRVFEHFPRLEERRRQLARQLSGGEQQMLSIGRALMSQPKILLLDEPSLGLAPIVVQQIGTFLREINAQGVTIVLVEQNADLALQLADYGYVLETGAITMEDEARALARNDHVKKAYLGI